MMLIFNLFVNSQSNEKVITDDDDELTGNPEDLEEGEDMVETKVGPGKKLKLEYDVEQANTQIWLVEFLIITVKML